MTSTTAHSRHRSSDKNNRTRKNTAVPLKLASIKNKMIYRRSAPIIAQTRSRSSPNILQGASLSDIEEDTPSDGGFDFPRWEMHEGKEDDAAHIEGPVLAKVVDDLVLESKNFQIVLKGGTLEKLIERLTWEADVDPENDMMDAFLMTYRTFLQPSELMEKLFQRYKEAEGLEEADKKKAQIIRLRVGNVIRHWLQNHFHDFCEENLKLVEKLEDYIEKVLMVSNLSNLGDQIKKTIERARKEYEEGLELQYMFNVPPPESFRPRTLNFTEFDELEVARQLCLIESNMYRSIHPKECLNQNWIKHKEKAENIVRMTDWFNMMGAWVASLIVRKSVLKERANMLKKFIRIAMHCKNLNNFNSAQEIVAGLNSAAIYRLKLTWAKIEGSKEYKFWEELNTLMDSKSNYKAYREHLKNIIPPCVPFFGVFLTDLTFIADGNYDYLPVEGGRQDIINFDKMRMVAAVIKSIQTYQHKPYNLREVTIIYDYFLNGLMEPVMEENDIFDRSKELEPKNPNTITPKKDRFSMSKTVRGLSIWKKKKSAK